MNLQQYIPKTDDWFRPFVEEMGYDEFHAYYDRVFLQLLDMRPGSRLRVTQVVRPQNYALFLGCAAMAISELAGYGRYDYFIEQQGTIIERHI